MSQRARTRNKSYFHITVLLFLILSLALSAQDRKWHTFTEATYPPTSFTLKKGIEYLELRCYKTNSKFSKVIDKNYQLIQVMYRKPLKNWDKRTVRRFHRLTPNFSKETNICRTSYVEVGPPFGDTVIMAYRIGGGFFIDSKGQLGRFNTVDDALSFLDTIDTESELEFALRIQGHSYCKRYRHTKRGYEVLCHQHIDFNPDKLSCGIYSYKLFMTNKGEIYKKSKYKLIKKTGCAVI